MDAAKANRLRQDPPLPPLPDGARVDVEQLGEPMCSIQTQRIGALTEARTNDFRPGHDERPPFVNGARAAGRTANEKGPRGVQVEAAAGRYPMGGPLRTITSPRFTGQW